MLELWRSIAQTSGAKIYSVLLGVLSLFITARILGPEGRGELAAIITWASTFSTFLYLSLGQVSIHKSASSEGLGWLSASFASLTTYATVLTLLGWIAAFAFYWATGGSLFGDISPLMLTLGFALLPFMIWEKYGTDLLMAVDKINIHNRYQIIGSTVGIIVTVVLLVVVGLGVGGALASNILAKLIMAMGGIVLLYKLAGGWSKPTLPDLKSYFYGGIKLHLNAIGTFFISGTDILMLNYYSGSEQTGWYQLGVQMMGMMLLVPQAACLVLYGRVSSLGPDKAWQTQKQILWQVSVFMIAGAVLAGISVQWWLPWLAGEAFLPVIDLFRWQLFAIVGMTFSTIMAPQWIGRGYFIQASLLTLAVGVANLAGNYYLIPIYGMYGAVYATLAVYVFSIFGNGLMALHCEIKCKSENRI